MKEITKELINDYLKDSGRLKYYNYSFNQWLEVYGESWFIDDVNAQGKMDLLKECYDDWDATIKKGTPCTIIYYSDRDAATVEVVECFTSGTLKGKPKRIGVRKNVCKCIDYYAGDWEVTDELQEGILYFTYRRNHTWVNEGGDTRDWGTKLAIGYRYTYEDPSF